MATVADQVNEQQIKEHAYWKNVFQQLGVRAMFLGSIDGDKAGGILLIPATVKDQALVTSMRNIARALGKQATLIEEEIKRRDPPAPKPSAAAQDADHMTQGMGLLLE
jgi:hypothetical protein